MLQLQIADDKWPQQPLSWDDPDAIVAWIEHLILEAERQCRGLSRGQDRMDMVIEAVVQSVELPDVAATLPPVGPGVVGRRGMARMVSQMVYSTLARNLPDNLRSPKD